LLGGTDYEDPVQLAEMANIKDQLEALPEVTNKLTYILAEEKRHAAN
jgi:hypothetical protein